METEDRLSALPDSVLCNILSFLPTHDAIATTLLSKRWQHLWLSVPALDLDDKTFLRTGSSYSSLFKFSFAALLSRNVHHPITLARLRLNSETVPQNNDLPYSDFKVWLNAVVQRGLERLHVEMRMPLKLPSCVLTCKTLVVLNMCRIFVDAVGPVDLPALKTLHLDCFNMSKTRYLPEILRGCPVLQDLLVNGLFLGNKWEVEFQTMPKLVRAVICNNFLLQIPLKAVCNVVYLRFFLKFNHQECFPVFHNLIHLELNFGSCIMWLSVFEMLKHCPKLQTFVLHRLPHFELAHRLTWSCPESVPECISSQLRKCTILNYEGKEYELQFAKYIMQNSGALQTMSIHNLASNTNSPNPQDKLEMLQELAKCPRSSAICELLFK